MMRDIFDTNEALITYCTKNYDETTRKDNLLFDLSHENKALQIFTSRYQQVLKICRADLARFDLPPELDIYGAGNIGKIFYDKIKGICRIGCFIDLRPREKPMTIFLFFVSQIIPPEKTFPLLSLLYMKRMRSGKI